MTNNRNIQFRTVRCVARALGPLNDMVIFVGGAVVGFYADDTAAEDVRPTKDVDLTVELTTAAELERFREALAARGIHPAADQNIMCRFTCRGILIDVMTLEPVGWAQANPWFRPGSASAAMRDVGEGVHIRLLSMSYFLASKLTAHHNRGGDPRASADLEDIVYILNNRLDAVAELTTAPVAVREYLTREFRLLLNILGGREALLAHLPPHERTDRLERLLAVMQTVAAH